MDILDRLGVKLPSHEGGKALPLHVDQNPTIDPDFKTLQGVLALVDCPAERGTFRGVPGSRNVFQQYAQMPGGIGEFVELDPQHPIAEELTNKAQAFPLRAGDMVSWDSRTTHANTENISQDPRMVFYVAAGLAQENNAAAVAARKDAFTTGLATSKLKVPQALLRATIKPRFIDAEAVSRIRKPENLTLLGKLLYGTERYDDIIPPSAS
ncbi:MAG: phytanoyl-CoA dioxygenase family protein [Alphaproteobacteria bacterium]|nr:phytanoyl-CoA dioxygenase family protein [Alphaproteobacteria bacterium]